MFWWPEVFSAAGDAFHCNAQPQSLYCSMCPLGAEKGLQATVDEESRCHTLCYIHVLHAASQAAREKNTLLHRDLIAEGTYASEQLPVCAQSNNEVDRHGFSH